MQQMIRTQVIGTVRKPDGHTGEIDGLVIHQRGSNGGWIILDVAEAIQMAVKGLLWCDTPGHGARVEVEAVDGNNDGFYDFVRTVPDHTRANNLLRLDVYDRKRGIWLDWRGNPIHKAA